MKNSAFTLVELLVVVAIIFLLISLTFPALRYAKERAKRVKCTSNMRQLGQAINTYAKDYSGWLPSFARSLTIDNNFRGDPEKGTLFPYHKDKRLYLCGSDKRVGSRNYYAYSYTWAGMCQIWVSSGLPEWWRAGLEGHGRKVSNFRNPSKAIMLAEENTDEEVWPAINDGIFCNVDFTDDRHIGKAVVVHVDGNVGVEKAGLEWNRNSGRNGIFGIQ